VFYAPSPVAPPPLAVAEEAEEAISEATSVVNRISLYAYCPALPRLGKQGSVVRFPNYLFLNASVKTAESMKASFMCGSKVSIIAASLSVKSRKSIMLS